MYSVDLHAGTVTTWEILSLLLNMQTENSTSSQVYWCMSKVTDGTSSMAAATVVAAILSPVLSNVAWMSYVNESLRVFVGWSQLMWTVESVSLESVCVVDTSVFLSNIAGLGMAMQFTFCNNISAVSTHKPSPRCDVVPEQKIYMTWHYTYIIVIYVILKFKAEETLPWAVITVAVTVYCLSRIKWDLSVNITLSDIFSGLVDQLEFPSEKLRMYVAIFIWNSHNSGG